MYTAKFEKLTLNFKLPSGTSRGILKSKDSWILRLSKIDQPDKFGYGEASIIKSLSPEWNDKYEQKLLEVSRDINFYIIHMENLIEYPSIHFAIETALKDLELDGQFNIFNIPKSKGCNLIPINGLIWMGDKDFMLSQIEEKINKGFTCIKLKIGAIDFNKELEVLKHIRNNYSEEKIEIRVDANGAFSLEDTLSKLNDLSQFDIHSIEQPIKASNWNDMAKLCKSTPIPIALDEELIGIYDIETKKELLNTIQPQYIILKPSLIGGFKGTDEWINIANNLDIPWWITSALESNIGLNAIAQYTLTKNNTLPQGLGTGGLYTNNIPPFLEIKNGHLII